MTHLKFIWTLQLLLFFSISTGFAAGGSESPYGQWTPPRTLRDFWNGVRDEWWDDNDKRELRDYCEQFAKTSSARKLLPDIVKDLKANPSMVRTFVYSWVVMRWPQHQVMPILKRYNRSKNAAEQKIADDLIADIEELNELKATGKIE